MHTFKYYIQTLNWLLMSTIDFPIMMIIVKYQCGCEIPKMTKSVVCGQRIEVT